MSAKSGNPTNPRLGGIRGLESDMTIGYGILLAIGGLFAGWLIFMLTRIVEAIVEDWTGRDEWEGE